MCVPERHWWRRPDTGRDGRVMTQAMTQPAREVVCSASLAGVAEVVGNPDPLDASDRICWLTGRKNLSEKFEGENRRKN